MSEKTAIIELNDASIYQRNTLILSEVNLKVYPGEFVFLIGKTGSGKSSIMKTLYGELPLQKGQGKVGDFDLNKITKRDIPYLRRSMGIVFQNFELLTDRTVAENLEFILKATEWRDSKKIKNRIDQTLSHVGLNNKGYKMIHQLSGGEQQRVVIARAILNEPNIIVADEPTGNLDPDTSDDIMALLKSLNRELGTAILMATHDYNLIEKFPARIYRCQENSVKENETISFM